MSYPDRSTEEILFSPDKMGILKSVLLRRYPAPKGHFPGEHCTCHTVRSQTFHICYIRKYFPWAKSIKNLNYFHLIF